MKRRKVDHPRRLMLAIRASAERGDTATVERLLDKALADPARRGAVVTYLSAYLSVCVIGFVPNLDRWTPPR